MAGEKWNEDYHQDVDSSRSQSANFFLWGAYREDFIPEPILTAKVVDSIRQVIIGGSYRVVVRGNGELAAWGFDRHGCLGMGTECTSSVDPKPIKMPNFGEEFGCEICEVLETVPDGQRVGPVAFPKRLPRLAHTGSKDCTWEEASISVGR